MNKFYFSIGISVLAATGVWMYSLYYSDKEIEQSALQKCVDGKLRQVPAYSKPGGAIIFTELCKELIK